MSEIIHRREFFVNTAKANLAAVAAASPLLADAKKTTTELARAEEPKASATPKSVLSKNSNDVQAASR
jgi:hypothetical protein